MITFNDIFKSNFIEKISSISILDMIGAMFFSIALGLFIFLIYKKTYSGVMYSNKFATTLVGLTMVTTTVILAVTSNVVLSLGMVGALSIVRFRTAIKDPQEIVFLFWAIAVGIVVGAGLIPIAVVCSLIIGGMMVIFSRQKITDTTYILVVKCKDEDVENAVFSIIDNEIKRYTIKTKVITESGIEISTELMIKAAKTAFVNKINDITGVSKVMLVNYNGEYMS